MEFLHMYMYFLVSIFHYGRFTQGTVEWLDNRTKYIGCSELGKLLNPTISAKKMLILNKLGVDKVRSGIYQLVWGHAFECSTKSFAEIFLNSTIFECCGSIQHGTKRVSCSPDGVGYAKIPVKVLKSLIRKVKYSDLKISRGKPVFDPVVEFYDSTELYETIRDINNARIAGTISEREKILESSFATVVVLYEFKSPVTRQLKDKIPHDYVCQVQGGMDTLKIANISIYAECRFVTCSYGQFGYNDDYLNFLNNNMPDGEFLGTKPKMMGIKFFVSNVPVDYDILITSTRDYDMFSETIYFGEDYHTFDLIFIRDDNFMNSKCFYEFCEMEEVSGIDVTALLEVYADIVTDLSRGKISDRINELVNIVKRSNRLIFAVQPWKLMDSRSAYVKPLEGFIDKFSDDIDDVLDSVNKLRGLEAKEILGGIPVVRNKNADIRSELDKILN